MDIPEINTVMSWLDGLSEDDWREFHSDSEVGNIAKAALELLKEQQEKINKARLWLKADGVDLDEMCDKLN